MQVAVRFSSSLLAVLLFVVSAVAQTLPTTSPTVSPIAPAKPASPAVALEAHMEKVEIARLRVHNIAGGEIEGSRDGGQTWQTIGHVLQPTQKVNRRGFTASKYAPVGSIAATAVNAIHLKASQNKPENRGVIWSLSPKADTEAGRVSLQSEVAPGASAFTDIPGGSGIFGGPFTPFVGNPISLDNNRDNTLSPLPDNYVPKLGDSWTVLIQRPRDHPREIVFENRFGGQVTIQYRGEEARVIGTVLKPVVGVGRFVGSYFSEVGRLRANHNGVIDVSTSPRGVVGSFQIVPATHANAPELSYIQTSTQWMVVGPVSVLDQTPEGVAPLFSSYLRPRFDVSDIANSDPVEGLAGRFLFEVKLRDAKGKISDWQPMPTFWLRANAPLPDWAKTCLSNMTALRIRFPFTFDNPAAATNAATTIITENRVLDAASTTTAAPPSTP